MTKKCMSGSALKWIAVITMFIDHLAAGVLSRYLGINWTEEGYRLYSLMRGIGRIAFPIFCFLLTEGFFYTKNRRRYALRLGVFALISEAPFDLLFRGRFLEFGYQNVFFTLFIGFVTMTTMDASRRMAAENALPAGGAAVAAAAGEATVAFLGMAAAEFMRTDYGALGVMSILVFYVFRKNRMSQIIAGCLAFVWWEAPALLAFLPIALYNGKRGRNIKYFFYLFYPVHLLLLYLLCMGLGLV